MIQLKNLLYLKDLRKDEINQLLDLSDHYLNSKSSHEFENLLKNQSIASLFFEPSTRTSASFQVAAKRLGAETIIIDEKKSSATKGETVLDTIRNLEAMGVRAFIIRTGDKDLFRPLINDVGPDTHIISAGESSISHPTQGLLDLLTIRQAKGAFEDLKVIIMGDISHSRVARSLVEGLDIMNTRNITLISPEEFKPEMSFFPSASYEEDPNKGLSDADVIVTLRVQKERIESSESNLSLEQYSDEYQLSEDKLELCKPDAIVMHPGPINRGIEISDRVADGKQSVILKQVENGVAMRMAVLTQILN
ncbi:MAG: aspartate carbamoyltransferase catalytic subunit [Gammaproteobacteria bacterium]|nr:aspartate carbamoyltransferase catalytic subunit [Gammaproteobacteria bacterium]